VELISGPIAGNADDPSVGTVSWQLLSQPYDTFILRWNWKAALLSAALRSPVFLLITLGHGWRRASLAMLVEAAFRAGSTGCFAAATQAFRNARPRWLALLLMSTGFPALMLALDGLLHTAMHTPNLAAGMAVSLIISALSSIFNWYAMRRGTLLVGEGGNSFWSDLNTLPALIFSFLLEPTAWIWRSTLQWLADSEAP
jgi:hypothetical protein